MSHQIYTDREAVDILLTEGRGADDVSEELNALLRSGLMLSQPPDMWLLTDEELVLLRLRLCEQASEFPPADAAGSSQTGRLHVVLPPRPH